MTIVDVALFESLAPRSRKKILCRCDRCGLDSMVQKGNLFRGRKNGKAVFYKIGQEPLGFVPSFDLCNSCSYVDNPNRCGRKYSDSTRLKIKAARARQDREGRNPRPSEDGKMRIAASKVGSKNPQWKADREVVAKRLSLRRACNNLIWNSIKRVSKKKVGRFEDVTGFSREDLVAWIESQFVEGMTWGNTSIDHIIPVVAFVDHGIDDLKVINHLSNLRPMFRLENISKGCRYNDVDFFSYLKTVNYMVPITAKDA